MAGFAGCTGEVMLPPPCFSPCRAYLLANNLIRKMIPHVIPAARVIQFVKNKYNRDPIATEAKIAIAILSRIGNFPSSLNYNGTDR